MIRVLFVCLGNICRSPMAEAVFAQKVREAGLENQFEIDSAGTGDYHIGDPAHIGTRRLLAEKNIPYDGRARQIRAADLNAFDYILTMDDENYRNVTAFRQGRAKVVRFLDFAPQTGVREVPDPWFTGNFEEVYTLVSAAADGLLAEIRREHGI